MHVAWWLAVRDSRRSGQVQPRGFVTMVRGLTGFRHNLHIFERLAFGQSRYSSSISPYAAHVISHSPVMVTTCCRGDCACPKRIFMSDTSRSRNRYGTHLLLHYMKLAVQGKPNRLSRSGEVTISQTRLRRPILLLSGTTNIQSTTLASPHAHKNCVSLSFGTPSLS